MKSFNMKVSTQRFQGDQRGFHDPVRLPPSDHGPAALPDAPSWRVSDWQAVGIPPASEPGGGIRYLLTAWIVYLARITGREAGQIGWHTDSPQWRESGSINTAPLIIPFHFEIDLDRPFHEISAGLSEVITALSQQNEAAGKYETETHLAPLSDLPWPIVVQLTENPDRGFDQLKPAIRHGSFILQIRSSDAAWRCLSNESAVPVEQSHRLSRHLGILLKSASAEAAREVPAGHLDLLPPDERTLLLDTWNQTRSPYPKDRCLHQFFEAQVHAAPHATALIHGDDTLSYAQLNAQANRLAHYLVRHGVKPDDRVAVCIERAPAMVVAILAVLKAGGAYVPIDPDYPSARLGTILDDAEPVFLLGSRASRSLFDHDALRGRQWLELDAPSPVWHDCPDSDLDPRELGLCAEHLAYVIYTSGSTGVPKGVMVEHRQLANYFTWALPHYYAGSDGGSPTTMSFSFDGSVTVILGPLLAGQPLTLLPTERQFESILDGATYSLIKLTPSHLKVLNALLSPTALPAPTSRLVLGGEAIAPADLDLWLHRYPDVALINEYGPTETTIGSTIYTADASTRDMLHVPIGRPIANTRIYLLDARRQPVPIGVVGEIYIGGDGVTRGYLKRPDLTAERFLDDPFSPLSGARMYRTGDLARYLPDGNLIYLGRNDGQIKIRGFRIEPAEIEKRITEHPDVSDAVIVAKGNGADRFLVAYVVIEPRLATRGDHAYRERLEKTLRAELAGKLPAYMVPSVFMFIETLPTTLNGKLDHRSLPEPVAPVSTSGPAAAPQGALETTIAALWREVLGVPSVGRDDSFFALGGHSLRALQMFSRIRSRFGVALPLSDLFTHPTLKDFSAHVSTLKNAGVDTGVPAIEPTPRGDLLPASFAQQRLWFLSQIEKVSLSYNIPAALRIRGALDIDGLRQSFQALMRRHESLRTVFVTVDGEPHVRLLPIDATCPLTRVDLSARAPDPDALAHLLRDEGLRPFDLAQGPLIRASLFRVKADEHVLLFTVHHIVSDGWSAGILLNELSAFYRSITRGEASSLAPLAVQYPDYAAWQRRWFDDDRLAAHLEYWRQALYDAPILLTLPTDRPRPAEPSHLGAVVPIRLDASLGAALRQLSREQGVTLFNILFAAWAAVLSRLAGQDDLVIGIPSANRGQREVEPLIGFFVNTLALRVDLSDSPSVEQLLHRVRDLALSAQDHQDVPFEQVVEHVNPPRCLEHAPLFQVLFAWQNIDAGALALAGLQVEPEPLPFERAKFDLDLVLSEVDETIGGSLTYATDLFDRHTIERHVAYLVTMLEAMVEDPRRPVATIDLLGANERALLLDTWNRTTTPYPDRLFHQLFEDQVQRNPHGHALVFGGETLTYQEVNARANRLAHHLIGLGVKPEERVAICVERSFDMIIGPLAIAKAGGAYVPLDPAYPSARLATILDNADPMLLLCDAAGRDALGDKALAAHTLLALDASAPAWGTLPDRNPDPADLGLLPEHLAYVIYTSGSTGTPKGVMVEHRHLPNFLLWNARAFEIDTDVRCTVTAGFSFDACVWEIWPPLIAGGTLLIPPAATNDTTSLLDWWCAQDVHFAFMVTPLMVQMLASGKVPPNLRYLLTGGDTLQHIPERIPPWMKLVNCYGCTENTVVATAGVLRDADTLPHIGRPIYNMRIYLLDAHRQPVPLGAVGEIYIGGIGVARGYRKQPELTAQRFMDDPFDARPGARMYRTHDLARYLADGNLLFLGRNDHQIKLRGFRIEPGEIEARMAEHAGVGECIVIAVGEGVDKRLVGYVVPAEKESMRSQEDAERLVATLRAHLSASLPDYMVPAAFVVLEAMPLTPNGKIDRKALPVPDESAFSRRVYAAPQDPVETALAKIWAELLGRDRIGRHDHFFELGGHSLLAVRLLSRVQSEFEVAADVRMLFNYPTLAQFAEALLIKAAMA
jgi:amino acid adenylation domain-containing protein